VITDYHDRNRPGGRIVLAVLGVALALLCLIAAAVFAWLPEGTLAAILQPTDTPSPTPTAMPTRTSTPLPLPTATPAPSPTPTVAEPQPHQWLERPFTEDEYNEATRYYPYGSTGGGKYRIHRGADFPGVFGTPIYAAARGRVIVAGEDARVIYGERLGFYGQLVVIQLHAQYRGQKVYVLYGHLSEVHVHFLQEVEAGDLIGEVGMSGVAIGPHLHIEVRLGTNSYEDTRNPELWLQPLPGKGTLVGRLVDVEGQPIPAHPLTVYRLEGGERRWQDATTYPTTDVSADDEWRENFALADVPAGEYVVKTYVSGHLYTKEFTIRQGETTYVIIEVT
jgi:murein DD-endopeptidase MepM/ murein hydrolase activator NlpD